MRLKLTLAVLASAAVVGCVEQGPTGVARDSESALDARFAPQFHYGPNPLKYTDANVRIKRPSSPTITERYSYWAELTDANVFQGRFQYSTTLASGPANVSGKVVCFKITPAGPSGLAQLGGVVTKSDNAEVPVGQPIVWSVSDNYEKRGDPHDTASSLLGLPVGPGDTAESVAAAYCAGGLPFPESPLLGSTYVHVEYLPEPPGKKKKH